MVMETDAGLRVCPPTGYPIPYHKGGGAACVSEGACTVGYALLADGSCSGCQNGYHDGGDGACVSNGTCSLAYALDEGTGECTLCNVTGGYHSGGPAGICLPDGQCAQG